MISATNRPKISDYEQHLLSYLNPAEIKTLSCGHVIPPSNLLAVPIVRALNGTEFDFTFEGRNKESTVSDFCTLSLNDTDLAYRLSTLDKLSSAWLNTYLTVL